MSDDSQGVGNSHIIIRKNKKDSFVGLKAATTNNSPGTTAADKIEPVLYNTLMPVNPECQGFI